ncbi:DUF6190 family protein [Kitasatospora sp. GAS204B]|uniref:DUF6190 family protein n=1 Tax=unclassified Kitasatospora TaxID=2633591 RepID=UPI002475CA44|nr:DUF6190 family protein [Kitasatospora sp. GAS204B]MDH6122390.1 hypothetical protein [Kitasatospora sp. GAS204B]
MPFDIKTGQGVEYVDATLFMGMNSTDEYTRAVCRTFFATRLGGRVMMSLEQVGRCDDLVWQFPREVQDAYYPFMDYLHTVMAIVRLGYEQDDLRSAPEAARYPRLATHERLLLGMVIHRGGLLRSVSARLTGRSRQPDLPVAAPDPGPELAFPQPLEELYQRSLALRIATAEL